MRIAAVALSLACGACGAKAAAPATDLTNAGAGRSGGADCPGDASELLVVHSVEWFDSVSGDGGDAWVLHERILPDDQDDLFPPEQEGMRTLTPAQARAYGARSFDGDGRIWVLDTGGAVCEAKLGEAIAVRRADGPLYTEIARRVDGCKPENEWLVFALARPPGSCRFVESQVVSRLTPASADNPQPMVGEIGKLLPGGCDEPECARFFIIIGLTLPEAERPSYYDVIVSDVRRIPGESECNWPVEDHRFRWARDADGALRPYQGEGHLAGALVDAGGVRLLFTSEPGRYFVYRAAGTEVVPAGELVWMVPHEEDFAGLGSAGPYCGP